MGVDLRAVKKQFADLVENIQPVAVSQFVVWLDEKVSEFKVNGQMRLDIELDAPAWIRKYSMSMLAAGLTPTTVDRTRPKITPKRPAPVFNSARKSTTTTMNNASTNRRFNRLPKIADVLNQSDTDDDVVATTQATIQAGAVRDAVLGAPAATITSRPSVSLLNNRPVSSKPKTSRSSPLTLTAVTAKLKQDRPEEPSQKSLKLEEVDTESFNEASYVDKHDVADTGCSEVDRFRSATVKTEPQDSTGDQQPPNNALGAFVVGDAPCLSDPHDDDLDMSVEDGAAYLYPTAIRDLDASEYAAINTNSTENSRVGEEISADLSNSGDYDGDGLESSYDDPADYMELINQSGSDKPHPGTSSESGLAVKQTWRRVNRRFPKMTLCSATRKADESMDELDDASPTDDGHAGRSRQAQPRGSVRKNLFNKIRFGERLDHKIVEWIREQQARNIHLKTSDIKNYALFVAQDVAPGFKASNGWLHKFKRRHNLYREDFIGSNADGSSRAPSSSDTVAVETGPLKTQHDAPEESRVYKSNILERLLKQPIGS